MSRIRKLPVVWRDELWKALRLGFRHALVTSPCARDRAEEAVRIACREARCVVPATFQWVRSPGEAVRKMTIGEGQIVPVWALPRARMSGVMQRGLSARLNEDIARLLRWAGTERLRHKFQSLFSAQFGGHGALDFDWVLLCRFLGAKVGLQGLPETEELFQIAEHAGWYFPFRDVCWMAERPTVCGCDRFGRLHNETGPALAFADGVKHYAIDGVTMQE